VRRTRGFLSFGFLLMGFSFTVTQGLLIREMLVAFFGNELSIGLILGNWLILEAIGSGLLGRLADRWGGRAASFAALQILYALFLPLCLWAVYSSRAIVGAIPGEGVGLVPIYWASFLILAPLALVDGAMFAFGCRAYARLVAERSLSPGEPLAGGEAASIGRVYLLEAAGAIAGGIVFTYLFITHLYSLQVVLVLAALNLVAAALVLVAERHRGQASSVQPGGRRWIEAASLAGVLVLLAACLGLLVSPLGREVQQWLAGRQWTGYHLVYSENSAYGNVSVVQQGEQYTFYADGIPVLTAPVPDVALVEEVVHLPALFVPQPRRALVLSGGAGGVLHELAKYPLERIDYAELDPLLIEAVELFPTTLTQGELADPRVQVETVDGRLLVRQRADAAATGEQAIYDLVLVNLPYPSTLQLNRFYTVEFFQLVQGLLSEEGVLVISTPGTLTYMSDELRNLNAMAYRSLDEVFPYVRPIPGDTTLWLASLADEIVTASPEALVERWEERGLEARLMSAPHIELRLHPRYLEWFWSSLGGGGDAMVGTAPSTAEARINRDLHPAGLFYGLSYWNAVFSPGLAGAFAAVGRIRLWTAGLLVVGCSLLTLVTMQVTGKGKGAVVPIAVAATGFAGMAAELVIIFAFQTLYGYVYHWIGLLITAFMGGLSLGALLASRRVSRVGRRRSAFIALEVALVLFWVLLPVVVTGLYSRIGHPVVAASIQGLLFLLNAVAGFLVGAQFPLANQLWLEQRRAQEGAGGVLYACDLVGATLGSVIIAVVLIPVLGIVETCVLAALVKAGSLALVVVLLPRG
jgi:spermidine synthase